MYIASFTHINLTHKKYKSHKILYNKKKVFLQKSYFLFTKSDRYNKIIPVFVLKLLGVIKIFYLKMFFLYLSIKININDCLIVKNLQKFIVLYLKIINFYPKKEFDH